MTTSTIHGLHARLRQIPKIIERRLIRLVLRERPRHRGAILLPGRRQSDVIPPHSLFDQTIGVFEDTARISSRPGSSLRTIRTVQESPISKLYSTSAFTDLTAGKLFKDCLIRRRAWIFPGVSDPQPDIASSAKTPAPTRIVRLGRPFPPTSPITTGPIHPDAPGRAR